jgi:5'-3' exonuclease
MCQSYLDGLCWVLNYYLQGPPSWEWFYPFHYAPCASDLTAAAATLSASVPHITYRMDFSSPLKPVEQLLSVLPAESAHALPLACQGLMTSPSSPLADVFHP